MENPDEILANISHRQYPLPNKPWKHYLEWLGNIILHWQVPVEELSNMIPKGLELDLFQGQVRVSFIAFSICNIRTENIPPVSFLSDFHEINLRTYVIKRKNNVRNE